MVEFYNHITKTQMWVADERVNEYKEAGFRPASEHVQPTKVEVKEEKKATTTKKTNKK